MWPVHFKCKNGASQDEMIWKLQCMRSTRFNGKTGKSQLSFVKIFEMCHLFLLKSWNGNSPTPDAVHAAPTEREAKQFHLLFLFPFIHADPLPSQITPDDLYPTCSNLPPLASWSNGIRVILNEIKWFFTSLTLLHSSGPLTWSHPPSHLPSIHLHFHVYIYTPATQPQQLQFGLRPK